MRKITDGTRDKFSQLPRRLSHPGMLSMRMQRLKLRGVTGSTSSFLVHLPNPPALSVSLRSVRGVTFQRHELTNLPAMMGTTNTRIHREVWRNASLRLLFPFLSFQLLLKVHRLQYQGVL